MNELTINLQTGSKIPLYEQIYNYVKENIQNGKLSSKEKLPSTRTLARHLEVSRSTIELAYEQLMSEGYIEAEPCRGYFVAQIEDLFAWEPERIREEEIPAREKEISRYDFSPSGVDLKSFPYNAWRKLSKESLVADRAELFRLGNSQGEWGLRKAISSYLYQARGVSATPEQIIVGAGNDYLLMLLCMILGSDYKVAMENPTYKQSYRVFSNLSYQVCTVNMDENGMLVSELKKSEADIAFVMPSHHYPLGTVMPLKRRMELLGTFSKSIAPAIRVSYMVLPYSLLEGYHKRAEFLSSTVSRVDQLILQNFIEQGYFERHLNKSRALYKGRHDALLAALKPLQDLCTISGEHAGVHLLLHFPELEEEELIRAAGKNGVKVYGLSEYYVEPPKKKEAVIMLGYANLSEEKIKEAVRLLEKAWRPLKGSRR